MDSSDTPLSVEHDERAAFTAKLSGIISKAEVKSTNKERTFLSRALFGGKKTPASAPANPEADSETPLPIATAGKKEVADDDQSAAALVIPEPATDSAVQEITKPPAFTIQPAPTMPSDQSATPPGNHPSQAQISFNFEITSLQLTPFFKLGGVQLKAVSNVVSLHLISAQTQENPLAASISFQIEQAELDDAKHLKSLLLKPLGESRSLATPSSKLQVDAVAISSGEVGAPISVTTSEQTSTAVQVFGTFAIAGMDFTPTFEIASLRLEAASNTVLLRVAHSSRPTALDLPPSFEVTQVQLGNDAQITGMSLSPTQPKDS